MPIVPREIEITPDVSIGGFHTLFLIAGPCVIESAEHAFKMAQRLTKICEAAAIPFIFKASYDKANRSSRLSFRGPGLEEGLKIAKSHGERDYEGMLSILLGKALARAQHSQSVRAGELILQGISILEELRIKPWQAEGYLYLGELYADTGQKDKALEALKKAEAEFNDMGMDYWLRVTQEVLARVER